MSHVSDCHVWRLRVSIYEICLVVFCVLVPIENKKKKKARQGHARWGILKLGLPAALAREPQLPKGFFE
jgi:hypothetical protein